MSVIQLYIARDTALIRSPRHAGSETTRIALAIAVGAEVSFGKSCRVSGYATHRKAYSRSESEMRPALVQRKPAFLHTKSATNERRG